MLEVIGKVLGSFLKSILVSVVMFVIVYSVLTKEFPPDFSKLQTTYRSLQELARLGQVGDGNIPKKKALVSTNSPGESDDALVDELEKINSQRVKLGAQLMIEGPKDSERAQEANVSSVDQTQLLERLRTIEVQLFKLQQRVAELESQKQK